MKRTVADFKDELELIKDDELRIWTLETLNKAPDYFWVAQSSSSGRFHPKCTIKEGGLITNIKRAVFIANHLCMRQGLKGLERDIVISATILHDIAKVPGVSVMKKYNMTVTKEDFTNHPINAKNYLSNKNVQKKMKIVYQCIKHPMGLWSPEKTKKPIKEYSLLELAVYTADYLSSRKDIDTTVDEK